MISQNLNQPTIEKENILYSQQYKYIIRKHSKLYQNIHLYRTIE